MPDGVEYRLCIQGHHVSWQSLVFVFNGHLGYQQGSAMVGDRSSVNPNWR